MNYLLRYPINYDDVEFLNETSYEYELFNPTIDSLLGYDSGWCDMGTGARVITAADRVIFRNVTPEQFTFLKLKYTDRLKDFTGSVHDIYNEAEIHNTSPLSVFDSSTVI